MFTRHLVGHILLGCTSEKMLCDSFLPGSSGMDWVDEAEQTYYLVGTNTRARDGRDSLRWCISGGTVVLLSY